MSALYVRIVFGGERVHLVRHAGKGAVTLCGRPPGSWSCFHVVPAPTNPETVCRACRRSHRRIYGLDLPAGGGAP